jgi:PAS domain S-box-containing protein
MDRKDNNHHRDRLIEPRDYRAELRLHADKLENLFEDLTRELRESEYLYRSIVEEAADAVVTLDEDARVVSWNRAASEIFGYAEEEALGKHIDELIAFDEGVKEEAHAFTIEAYSGAKIQSRESVRYTRQGLPRRVLISATPIMDDQGLVYLISLMYKDITNLYEAHQRLIQSEKQATLGIIAGSIGHELNNLVGGLLLQAQTLIKNPDDPARTREKAELLLGHVEKIVLHGKNLLSLSQPTKPEMVDVDLAALLEQTTETLVVSGVLKRLHIIREYEKDLPMIHGDTNLLEQVVRNVEINSAHAMESGGTLTIGCRLSAQEGFVEMFIKDTGPGIAPEILDRVFEPFFTTKSEGKGTGLGLPIVKQIVEQHGGRLVLDSGNGKGTAVIISLPISGPAAENRGS